MKVHIISEQVSITVLINTEKLDIQKSIVLCVRGMIVCKLFPRLCMQIVFYYQLQYVSNLKNPSQVV